MTDAERRLWSLLRDRKLNGHKFRRQHPVGPYVLDFACIEQKLAVEVDGGQHADSEHDRQRTAWLESQEWWVVRFWNHDVLTNAEGVVARLTEVLRK